MPTVPAKGLPFCLKASLYPRRIMTAVILKLANVEVIRFAKGVMRMSQTSPNPLDGVVSRPEVDTRTSRAGRTQPVVDR
jgi:hypothetical protein